MRIASGANSAHPPGSFQCHHLIPMEVIRADCFSRLFGSLRRLHFHPHNFASNGILLPSNEKTAVRSGLPLHRGPHPRYTEIVMDRVGAIERSLDKNGDERIALERIRWLQKGLRKSLKAGRLCKLNRRDPMRAKTNFHAIDAAIMEVYTNGNLLR